MKVDRETIHNLRNGGKTFADIGRMFDVSRQYIHSRYSGYANVYRKTDKYKMYKRHSKGHASPYKPCDYCLSTPILSTPSTN